MNLVLIGYRATGKTTLARHLAARLGWEWTDADVEIERRAGKSIARIFAEEGEPAFRDLEAQVIADLCERQRLVLAAGGGALFREESRRAMRCCGRVVWLTATPETILARMTADATTPDAGPASPTSRRWKRSCNFWPGANQLIVRRRSRLSIPKARRVKNWWTRSGRANVTLILSIPIEFAWRSFSSWAVLGSVMNLGIYWLAWNPRPIGPWSRPPANRRRGRFGIACRSSVGSGCAASQIARARLLGPADAIGDSHRGDIRAPILVGGRRCRLMPPTSYQEGTLPLLTPAASCSRADRLCDAASRAILSAHIVLFCFMLAAFWIDVDDTTIPDGVTVPGTLLGLIIWRLGPMPVAGLTRFPRFGLPVASSVWLTSPTKYRRRWNPRRRLSSATWEVRRSPAGRPWPRRLLAFGAGVWPCCRDDGPRGTGYCGRSGFSPPGHVRERVTYGLLVFAVIGSGAVAWVWSLGGPQWAGLGEQTGGNRGRRRTGVAVRVLRSGS